MQNSIVIQYYWVILSYFLKKKKLNIIDICETVEFPGILEHRIQTLLQYKFHLMSEKLFRSIETLLPKGHEYLQLTMLTCNANI